MLLKELRGRLVKAKNIAIKVRVWGVCMVVFFSVEFLVFWWVFDIRVFCGLRF